jgi:DNA-binding beta-propeller fold protein YncE
MTRFTRFLLAAVAALVIGLMAFSGAAAAREAPGAAGRTVVAHVTAPGCTDKVQPAPGLPASDTTLTRVPGAPFGVAATPDGRWAFVALGAKIGVFSVRRSGALSLRHLIAFPAGEALGVALSPDGRYLLVADAGNGAAVFSVPAAERGSPHAQLGVLAVPGLRPFEGGAIEVHVSRRGGYAFVSLEDGDSIAVFNLRRAVTRGFGRADYVGSIPTQVAPVGLALSPNGRWLYSTSEAEKPATNVGSVSVISVARAERDPARSVISRVAAGCNPVRVITSADGSVVWVTARASDALLAFSARRLRTDPAHALLADVRVGELPVGLALVRGGSLVVVADSDRFDVPGARASLAVVSVREALAGRPAVLGYLRAGKFPREMALEARGMTLLVGNYASGQLETVDIAALP